VETGCEIRRVENAILCLALRLTEVYLTLMDEIAWNAKEGRDQNGRREI
jgi:hypothetical protein